MDLFRVLIKETIRTGDWVNPSKRGGMDGVFRQLAWLLQGISRGQSPREISLITDPPPKNFNTLSRWKKWHMTCDMWHVTCYMWHMTYEMWWGVNILSKFQLPSSNDLWFMIFLIFGGKESLSQLIIKSFMKVFVEQPRLHLSVNLVVPELKFYGL